MLRISLIIAIVAGLAAAGLNFYKVRQVMVDTMTERDNERTAKEKAQKERDDTKKTLVKTEDDLKKTQGTLATTEKKLKDTSSKLAQTEKQAADLTADLDKTRADRDTAQQTLAQWNVLGVSPDQVRGIMSDLKKTKEEAETLAGENKIVSKKLAEVTRKLDDFLGPDRPVELPAGLKGKVVAVDPKYDFVVVNVGGNEGVLERGELLVNRNGKLVGKLRVSAVQPNQSIANVDPQWKRAEIMEGDQVLARTY